MPLYARRIATLMIFFTMSATLSAQETKPAPPTPIDVKKAELGGTPWNSDWDQIIEQAIPPELLSSQAPRGVLQFCPRFYDMSEVNKRAFWAYFFQALAGAEAGLNPDSTVRHAPPSRARRDNVSGKPRRTEGLLQLAYEDQQRYGCDFDWQADSALKPTDPSKSILQPKNNLECGVKILFTQTITQHKPLLSRSSYWATLQPNQPSFHLFTKQMINPPAACASPAKAKNDIAKTDTTVTVEQKATQSDPPK